MLPSRRARVSRRPDRPAGRRVRAGVLAVAVAAGALVGCSGDDPASEPAGAADSPDVGAAPPADFDVHPGVEQLLVTGAGAEVALTVRDGSGAAVATGTTDAAGQLVVRELAPGDGYTVVADDGDPVADDGDPGDAPVAGPVAVLAVDDVPDDAFYADQELGDGYQYFEARDGTQLAVNVVLPGPVEDGPYPTVIEYSGYDPANPDGFQPSMRFANQLGYAAVGVNMRGTGCSGGSFLFFEPAQWTDGYDAVEVVARQPWVDGGRVGMVGLSYAGISQLFVAQTRPPSLAAITPLSVIADTYRSTLYPGGILNDGFAISWAEERQADAEPAGQGWAAARIEDGDEVCEANQALRSQNPDTFAIIDDHRFVPEDRTSFVGRLAPSEWVDEIDVPVFLAGAWQDEQTGGDFATMLDRFTSAPVTRFTFTNGGHADPFGPEILARWTEFLDLYVAERVPRIPDAFRGLVPLIGREVFGTDVTLGPDRFADVDSYEEALARYEAEPPVRILFESGAGGEPGAPAAGFEVAADGWPVPSLVATTWYLDADGRLVPDPPSAAGEDTYRYDPSRSQVVTLPEGGPWQARPDWVWEPGAEDARLVYETAPLDGSVVMAGTGRVDLHLGSSAPDVDVQVTISEVRSDGVEYYVQNGWLRASHRTLDPDRSGDLRAYHTHLESDAAPLPAGEVAELNIAVFPFAHVFRDGSRIRLTVDAPGGTRPEWRFDVVGADRDDTVNRVARGGEWASRVVLPVVPGVEVPTPAPPCPALRGQPCRAAR